MSLRRGLFAQDADHQAAHSQSGIVWFGSRRACTRAACGRPFARPGSSRKKKASSISDPITRAAQCGVRLVRRRPHGAQDELEQVLPELRRDVQRARMAKRANRQTRAVVRPHLVTGTNTPSVARALPGTASFERLRRCAAGQRDRHDARAIWQPSTAIGPDSGEPSASIHDEFLRRAAPADASPGGRRDVLQAKMPTCGSRIGAHRVADWTPINNGRCGRTDPARPGRRAVVDPRDHDNYTWRHQRDNVQPGDHRQQ